MRNQTRSCLSFGLLLVSILFLIVINPSDLAQAKILIDEEGVTFTPTYTATSTPTSTPTPTDTPTLTPTLTLTPSITPTGTLPPTDPPTITPIIFDPTGTPRPQPGGTGNSGYFAGAILIISTGIFVLILFIRYFSRRNPGRVE